ncbi:hypothetical protein MNBD_GAMMA24-2380 [hydrothermal vent metagenome]|uniref:Lipo-like protein n=1 Tax=hydrothermal vent metagenome TaxID=652676 RepID=A0A3B1BDD7_9ZZZZ
MAAVGIRKRLLGTLTRWLNQESSPDYNLAPLSSFERLCYEIRPGDVILVEGRSRVSEVIKLITQSPWTHSALYIGRLYELGDRPLQNRLVSEYRLERDKPYIIEALLGEGTVIYPLEKYSKEHLRICRPKGLSPEDTGKVIHYAVNRLGNDYDIRHLLDLARFMLPYAILPRRWRSSLFSHNAGIQTRTVCSTMIGEAFQSVRFPILPFAEKTPDNKIHLYQRNPRLLTPRDFDFSPYFDIVKYPFFNFDDLSLYRRLPWAGSDLYCNNLDDCYTTPPTVPDSVNETGNSSGQSSSNNTAATTSVNPQGESS